MNQAQLELTINNSVSNISEVVMYGMIAVPIIILFGIIITKINEEENKTFFIGIFAAICIIAMVVLVGFGINFSELVGDNKGISSSVAKGFDSVIYSVASFAFFVFVILLIYLFHLFLKKLVDRLKIR